MYLVFLLRGLFEGRIRVLVVDRGAWFMNEAGLDQVTSQPPT